MRGLLPCEDSEILQSHDNSDYVSLKLHIHLQVKPSLIAWLIKTIITLIVFISQGHLLSSFVSLAHALLTQARKLTPLVVKSTGATVDFILELNLHRRRLFVRPQGDKKNHPQKGGFFLAPASSLVSSCFALTNRASVTCFLVSFRLLTLCSLKQESLRLLW